MDTFLGRYRNLVVLAAVLFAQIVGLAVQVRRPTNEGETRLIRLWVISAVTPFEKAVVHSQQWVENLWTTYVYLHGVRRENRDLRAEIEHMKIDEARLEEDARMARRVQTLFAFKEQYVDSTVAAQVIGTSGSDQSRVLYIDKGAKDGIKPDMAVITPTGIVGKIVQTAPEWSQVLPINDQFSGVGAALKASRLQGILKGAANGATTLQYIMSDEKVVPGEEVITSGGDRIFPKGLPVGKVVAVEPGKDLFLNIRVVPAAHLDRLEEVLIVTKITEKMPDPSELGPIRASDILAERLPSVPNKTEVDAAGNAKAPGATPAPGSAAPAGGVAGAAARPTAAGSLTGKPAAAATGTLNPNPTASAKPNGATAHPGIAASTGTTKSKPAAVGETHANELPSQLKKAPVVRPPKIDLGTGIEPPPAARPSSPAQEPPSTEPANPSGGAQPQP